MNYKKFYIYIIILGFCVLHNYQNIFATEKIDSLEKTYLACKTNTCRISTQLELTKYYLNTDTKKALKTCKNISNTNGIDNNIEQKALLYQLTGNAYRKLAAEDSSAKYLELAIGYYIQLNKNDEIILLYNDIGSLYSSVGAYNVSLNYFIKGLKFSEQSNSQKYLALLYNSIGNTYGLLNQYSASNENYNKAIAFNKDSNFVGNIYNNIAINFSETKKYDSAIYYLRIANNIHQSLGNTNEVNNNYINLANAFALSSKFDSAHYYIDKSIDYFLSVDDEWMLGYCYDIKGNTFRLQKQYEPAKKYLLNAIEILKKYEDSWALKETYMNAYYLENDMGNYKQALYYFTANINLKDSIFNAGLKSEIYHLDKLYETEKKESQILLLNKENEIKNAKIKRNTIVLISFIILSLLLFIILYVLNKNNKFKTKTNIILEEKNQQLNTLNATKDKLFSIVSHDLKNPLSAFRNITLSLKNHFDKLSKNEIEEYIIDMNDSSNKLMDLLENILKWATTQTKNININKSKQPLLPIVNRAIDTIKFNAEQKNIEIQNLVTENIIANIDENIIDTILRNFITNAIKFTPQNGTIEIFTETTNNNELKICVKDSGIGISIADQNKLFSIYNNANEIGNSAEKGTGLGLILCKEFIEKMNGTIGVQSEENKGSIFYIQFKI